MLKNSQEDSPSSNEYHIFPCNIKELMRINDIIADDAETVLTF